VGLSFASSLNRASFDALSKTYDNTLKPEVTLDEICFPLFWYQHSGIRALDIGCGTGRHTRRLVELQNIATGIDFSQGMLSIAADKITDEKANFICDDFLSYAGFAPNSFDLIISSLVVEYILEIELFFLKAASLLRRGGELYISQSNPKRFCERRDPETVEDEIRHGTRFLKFPHTRELISKCASNGGLTGVTERDIDGNSDLATICDGWSQYVGKPMIQILGFRK
jgi:SAM-dependent methyltransferase